MKKKTLAITIATLTITSMTLTGGFMYANNRVNELRQEIELRDGELKDMKQIKETLDTKVNEMNQELENLHKDIELKESENNNLRQQITDMTKSVSFNPTNVSQPSGVTVYHMKKALNGTEMHSFAEAFVQAEKDYGVNAFFLAGVVALESGWATSNRARNGSNNLTGHAVYNDTSAGTYFSSPEECVLITARDISRDYLSENGIYNNGLSVDGVNTKYSASDDWDSKVTSIAYSLLEKANA